MTTVQPTFEDFVAWLEDSRGHGQVHFDDKQRCWQVLGHPETVAVLSDPAVFSSDLTALQPDQDDLALFQRGNFVRAATPRRLPRCRLHGAPRCGGASAVARCWPPWPTSRS